MVRVHFMSSWQGPDDRSGQCHHHRGRHQTAVSPAGWYSWPAPYEPLGHPWRRRTRSTHSNRREGRRCCRRSSSERDNEPQPTDRSVRLRRGETPRHRVHNKAVSHLRTLGTRFAQRDEVRLSEAPFEPGAVEPFSEHSHQDPVTFPVGAFLSCRVAFVTTASSGLPHTSSTA